MCFNIFIKPFTFRERSDPNGFSLNQRYAPCAELSPNFRMFIGRIQQTRGLNVQLPFKYKRLGASH